MKDGEPMLEILAGKGRGQGPGEIKTGKDAPPSLIKRGRGKHMFSSIPVRVKAGTGGGWGKKR